MGIVMRKLSIGISVIVLLMASHAFMASADQNFGPKHLPVINFEQPNTAVENPWILRRDQYDVQVYTRKVKGSPILEFRADIIIHAPIDAVLAVFEDDGKVPLWFYHRMAAEFIEQTADLKRVYYFLAKLPWPISARDAVFERIKSTDPLTGEVRFDLKSLPDSLPKTRGVVRVKHFNASWRLIPLSDGSTKVYFQQHSHPEGFIPPFMANQLVTDVPFYSLKNLRTLIEEKKPQEK
jgi:hypothetical protein